MKGRLKPNKKKRLKDLTGAELEAFLRKLLVKADEKLKAKKAVSMEVILDFRETESNIRKVCAMIDSKLKNPTYKSAGTNLQILYERVTTDLRASIANAPEDIKSQIKDHILTHGAKSTRDIRNENKTAEKELDEMVALQQMEADASASVDKTKISGISQLFRRKKSPQETPPASALVAAAPEQPIPEMQPVAADTKEEQNIAVVNNAIAQLKIIDNRFASLKNDYLKNVISYEELEKRYVELAQQTKQVFATLETHYNNDPHDWSAREQEALKAFHAADVAANATGEQIGEFIAEQFDAKKLAARIDALPENLREMLRQADKDNTKEMNADERKQMGEIINKLQAAGSIEEMKQTLQEAGMGENEFEGATFDYDKYVQAIYDDYNRSPTNAFEEDETDDNELDDEEIHERIKVIYEKNSPLADFLEEHGANPLYEEEFEQIEVILKASDEETLETALQNYFDEILEEDEVIELSDDQIQNILAANVTTIFTKEATITLDMTSQMSRRLSQIEDYIAALPDTAPTEEKQGLLSELQTMKDRNMAIASKTNELSAAFRSTNDPEQRLPLLAQMRSESARIAKLHTDSEAAVRKTAAIHSELQPPDDKEKTASATNQPKKSDDELIDEMMAGLNDIKFDGAKAATASNDKGKGEVVYNDNDKKLIVEIDKSNALLSEATDTLKKFAKNKIPLPALTEKYNELHQHFVSLGNTIAELRAAEPKPDTTVLNNADAAYSAIDEVCGRMQAVIVTRNNEIDEEEKNDVLRQINHHLPIIRDGIQVLMTELSGPGITIERANEIQEELIREEERINNDPGLIDVANRLNAIIDKLHEDEDLINARTENAEILQLREDALALARSTIARLSAPPPPPPPPAPAAPAINPYHFFAENEAQYDAQKQKISHLLGKFSAVEKKANRAELASASLSKSAISADNRSKIINNIDTQIEELNIYRALLEDNLRRKNSDGTDNNIAPPHQPRAAGFHDARPINNTPAEIQATIDKATACIGKLEAAKNVINAIPAAGAAQTSYYSKLNQGQAFATQDAAVQACNAFFALYPGGASFQINPNINAGIADDKTTGSNTFRFIGTEIQSKDKVAPVGILQQTNAKQTFSEQTLKIDATVLKNMDKLPFGADAKEAKMMEQLKFMISIIESGLSAIKTNGPVEVRNFPKNLDDIAAAYCKRMGYELADRRLADNLNPKTEAAINAAMDKLVKSDVNFKADILAAEARIDLKKGLLPTPESKRFR